MYHHSFPVLALGLILIVRVLYLSSLTYHYLILYLLLYLYICFYICNFFCENIVEKYYGYWPVVIPYIIFYYWAFLFSHSFLRWFI